MEFLSKGLHMISGPCNSGKSLYAEKLLDNHNKVIYIATSENNPEDSDWIEKIEKHKKRRNKTWKLIETSTELSEQLSIYRNESILIESLGGYVAALLSMDNESWNLEMDKFILSISNHKGTIVIVSEEVGWSTVPSTKLGNTFMNRLTSLSFSLNKHSASSWLVIQGTAIDIKMIGVSI